jgi:hypothetical protein
MAWQGYFLMSLKGGLSDGLTPEQSAFMRQKFGVSFSGLINADILVSIYPEYRLQTRLSVNEKKIICEAYWREEPTKQDIINVLVQGLGKTGAALLGVPEELLPTALDASFDLLVFGKNSTLEQSRKEVSTYLQEHIEEWQIRF